MGALINIFKRLFGGIFGFIGGLIGGKKAIEGATVEGNVEAEKSIKAPKAKKPKKGKDGFYVVADESMMEELPAANAIVSTTDAVTTDAKGKKVKAVPANAVVAKVAAPMSSEELIIAALKPNQAPAVVGAEVQAPTAGFATQYLVPTLTSGRRSPGPSLKGFKAMAKEIRG